MAKRFHINPRTGNPGQCSARISCPYGNLENDHFDSAEEARTAYEAGQLDGAFATLSKTLDEVVAPEPNDQELLDALAKDPNWVTFDPTGGEDQLQGTLFTDETMDEMAAAMEEARKYELSVEWDEDEYGNDFSRLHITNYGEITGVNEDETKAAERIIAAGGWGEFASWDEAPEDKLRTVTRHIEGAEASVTYIHNAKLRNAQALEALGSADDLGTASKRFNINLDNALLTVADEVLRSEEDKAKAEAMLPQGENPPF